MATLITATSDSDTKPNYQVTSGAPIIDDGELILFIGDNTGARVQTYNGIRRVADKIREAGWPQPPSSGGELAIAYNVPSESYTDTPSEEDVAVIIGFGFTPAHDSGQTHIMRMAELWMETTKAA